MLKSVIFFYTLVYNLKLSSQYQRLANWNANCISTRLIVVIHRALSMDNNKTENRGVNQVSEKGNSRRGFIKKTSMVAGISMLPASNVWGVCNVSGVSGGSQAVNQTCLIPSFFGGFSPSVWQQFVQVSTPEEYASVMETISSIPSTETMENSDALKVEVYFEWIRDFLNNSTVVISSSNELLDPLNMNVGSIFNAPANSKKKLVAAVVANYSLGFIESLPAQYTGPNGFMEFVEHIWGSLQVNGLDSEAMINSSFIGNQVDEATLASKLSS